MVLVNFSYVGRKLLKGRRPVLYFFALSFHVTNNLLLEASSNSRPLKSTVDYYEYILLGSL